METISRCYLGLENPDLPALQIQSQIAFAQNKGFFHLAVAKEARMSRVREAFAHSGVRKVWLSGNLGGFECDIPGFELGMLPRGFFEIPDEEGLQRAAMHLHSAVVIINNNDLGSPEARQSFSKLYERCESTCFVAWDWDNHHWLGLSTFLAAHSDLYAPAHHENLYLLTRYNWLTAGPIYCTSVQWSRKFLSENLGAMLSATRQPVPLGMHIPYSQFEFRIQVISTISQYYPSVGFSSRSFHARSSEDRLGEWVAHQMHWIMPVLNDVPIRIFDALITGGIPMVPASMRLLSPLLDMPEDFVVFYSPGDIVNPSGVVQRARELFEKGGAEGIARRHRYAMEHFHGDVSVQRLLQCVVKALEPCSSRT